MTVAADNPAGRAALLLRDVLGEQQHQQLRGIGYLDLPSRKVPGRMYRLDSLGNLSYRDPGEATFNTTLCVQPREFVPRDDQVAMRYLLVTADEERLLEVANPITFGLLSLVRALYHDFSERNPAWLAALITASLVLVFVGAVAGEAWTLLFVLKANLLLAIVLFLVLCVPALVGVILLAAGAADVVRYLRARRARRARQAV
jgi:hypothetical protein